MNKNPFFSPIAHATAPITQAGSCPPMLKPERTSNVCDEDQVERGFLICVGLASAAFLIAMLFVFQEVRHTRELYRMSRFISHVEAEKQEWREKQRIEEARTAELLATLNSDPSLRPTSLPEGAKHAVAMR